PITYTITPLFYIHSSAPSPDLHSFPTRRSSDLSMAALVQTRGRSRSQSQQGQQASSRNDGWSQHVHCHESSVAAAGDDGRVCKRSEEHTSELQSQSNLVCRLLLEKKKKT